MIQAQPAHAGIFVLSEGPVWDPGTGRLTWVDIDAGSVLSAPLTEDVTGPRLGRVARVDFGEQVGCAIPLPRSRILVALRTQLAILGSDGALKRGSVLVSDGQRFNDGKIDPQGRLVVGTLWLDDGNRPGNSLLRIEGDGSITTLDDDLVLSTGLGWSPAGSIFYSTDTGAGKIFRREYGADVIGPREEFIIFDDDLWPDGLTVDANGNLWVAIWGSGEVCVYGPDGRRRLDLGLVVDAPHTSSVTFAGDRLDIAVITTASRDLDADALKRLPHAGEVFLGKAIVTGLPATPWVEGSLP